MAPAPARVLLLALMTAVMCADDTSQSPAWGTDLTKALDQAKGKPIALLFATESCVWCHRMRDESDASPEVRQALHDVVGVVVDAEHERALAARFNISAFPTLVLVNRKMQLVRIISGYQQPADLTTILRVLALHGDEDGQAPADLRGEVDIAALRAAPDGMAQLVALLGSGPTEQRAKVREALSSMPSAKDALWPKLDDEHLGVRVDAAAVLAHLVGQPPDYDPLADAGERSRAITAWKRQLVLPGGGVP